MKWRIRDSFERKRSARRISLTPRVGVGHALGISWGWSVAWGVLFGAVTAAALIVAQRSRPRDPRSAFPWLVAGGVVSLIPVVVALVRGSFDTSQVISAVTAALFLAAAAVTRRERQPR